MTRGEFVIRNKSQKVSLFKAGAGPGASPPGPTNHLYRIRNLGPGDIKVPNIGYIFAGCTIDIPGNLNVQGGIVLSTEGAASTADGSNGIEQAAGWFEILDPPCCCKDPEPQHPAPPR